MNAVPKDMLVEVTNRCNHACVFCANRRMDPQKVKKGEIDPVLLKRLLREAYEMGVRRVGFYTTGEMFMCKHIETHIQNAKELGFTYIYSDTNGALATKENMRRVLLAGLDSIKFSINAGTRETYQYIHGKDDFETVMKNLEDCHALREELGLDFKILASCVVTSRNEDEVEALRERISPYIDSLDAHGIRAHMHQYAEDLTYLLPERYEGLKPPESCAQIFNRIHVTYDGFLNACCIDFNHDMLLADLKMSSLKDAWNCGNFIRLRQRHLNGELSGILCDGCMVNQYRPYSPLPL